MCLGFIFPVSLWKHKYLSFWDEKILQDCCSIKHPLFFTSLFIFGSVDFSYFHGTLAVHLRGFMYFYFVYMYLLVFLGSLTKYYLLAYNDRNLLLTVLESRKSKNKMPEWSLFSKGPFLVHSCAFLLCPHVVEQPRVCFVALSSWLNTSQRPHMLILSTLSIRTSTCEFRGNANIQIIAMYKSNRLTSGSRGFVKGGISGYFVTKLSEIETLTFMFLNIAFSYCGYMYMIVEHYSYLLIMCINDLF